MSPDLNTELLSENKALRARIQELEQALDETASLAKFPSENPNPVLRIADDGTVLYANEVAESILKTLGSGKGQSAPDLWHRQVLDAMASGYARLFDVEYLDHIFSFALVPVQNFPYVNWYGRDVTERMAAEATLAFSRRILNDTGKIAKIGGWEHDLRTGQATWTEALYDIIEIPYDQPIPGPDEHLAYYPEKDREVLRLAYQKAVDEHVSFDLELQGYTRNKKLLWFRAYGEPVLEDGQCVKIRGTFQNITQRKRAEEDSVRLAKFPAENPSPVLRVANEGTITYANAACSCLLEKWGCQIGDLLPQDLHNIVTETVRTGKVQQREVECCQIIYMLTFAPIKDSDFINIYGLEITDQKNSENKLRKSLEREQFLGNIIRDASVAIGIGYPDGRLHACNQAFVRLTGYSEEELKNIDWNLALTPQEWREHEAHYLQQLDSAHETVCYEKEYIRKDGTRVPIELLVAARFDPEGAPIHYVGFVNDITERKANEEKTRQVQEQLLDQQKNETLKIQRELAKLKDELVRSTRLAAIGQVSASIAHDLRNPLAAVHNATYLLKYYLPEPEEKLTRQLATIDKELKRSNKIISNLLNLARAKKPDKQAVSLRQLVQETVEHARFPEGIGWQMICEPDPFMVYADPAQLGQVIGNLLVNAIEAMAGSGTITVQAQQEGSNQVIWFRDTGPGFSPQIVGDPREPLITTKITGTGLGLTICRDIVAQHGGTLTIEKNTEPGAVICVTLPKRVERILHEKQQRNTQK